jgi:HlyD family secretion protein
MKRVLQGVGVFLLVLAIGWALRPNPVPVDLAVVAKGPMDVTVDDEGKTQVRDVYVVSAPLGGKLLRIPGHVGDAVTANETVLAVMQPTVPSFHDPRYHEELKAALAASNAAVALAEHEVQRIGSALHFSRTEYERAQTLVANNLISAQAIDKARYEVESNEAALASAKAQLEVRRSERASAAARLTMPSSGAVGSADPACCLEIRAPVSGRVLKVIQESESVVPAGAPVIDIGDPTKLEVVADLLSSDAVKIDVGAPVSIDGWGGPAVRGRVRRVDPAGFVKISSLGIEEQRVRTTIDFVDPPEAWSRLGHDYRVYVHVTTWHADDIVTVPVAALFRTQNDWAVFAVSRSRAKTVPVEIGQRNNRVAQVISGLAPGDEVVLHPSDRVEDGVSVAQRSVR